MFAGLATGASTSDGGTLIMFSYSSCVQLFCVRAPVFPLDALRKVESYSLGLLDQRAQHESRLKEKLLRLEQTMEGGVSCSG